MYLNYIGACIYSQKLGETCNVWDAPGLIKDSLKLTPLVRILREKPEIAPLTDSNYKEIITPMQFKDIQKIAAGLLVYDPSLNQSIIRSLEKAGIRSVFDIGIHLTSGMDENTINRYFALVRAFHVRSKKDKLNIYIMADKYDLVEEFQKLCAPSWKVITLSKNVPRDADELFIQTMAEVQIMTALPSLILDFTRAADRYIYLMQRNPKLEYFAEMSSRVWALI